MSRTTVAKSAAKKPAKAPVSMGTARLVCPNHQIAENVARAFGLTVPDHEEIQSVHEQLMRKAWLSFGDALNETATKMHFQRLAGTFVASAQGAGNFYTEKLTQARDLTSKLANEDRDEDREPIYGFETRAERARKFAADLCMQAYALLAAAEGAVAAYKEITGEEWMPYVAQTEGPNSAGRKSVSAEMSAFS
ncbi:MAG TPA: hypothetical protein VMU78_08585 [Methylocella sp.]|nr:hypothetical protein [Methylocella sp.]